MERLIGEVTSERYKMYLVIRLWGSECSVWVFGERRVGEMMKWSVGQEHQKGSRRPRALPGLCTGKNWERWPGAFRCGAQYVSLQMQQESSPTHLPSLLGYISCPRSLHFVSFFFLRFYLFIFRERAREGEREGETHWCSRETSVCASHMPPTKDLARNPGTGPDWELNQQCFDLRNNAQPTEPHQSG